MKKIIFLICLIWSTCCLAQPANWQGPSVRGEGDVIPADTNPTPGSDQVTPITNTPKRLCCYTYMEELTGSLGFIPYSILFRNVGSSDPDEDYTTNCPNGSVLTDLTEKGGDEATRSTRMVSKWSCAKPVSACSYINADETTKRISTPSGSITVECRNDES